MKRARVNKATCALMAAVAGVAIACSLQYPIAAATARAAHPNVIVVQVDDLSRSIIKTRVSDGRSSSVAMPKAQRLLTRQGVTFSRYYASNPICAPSRASLLSGLSTHNHGMEINAYPFGYNSWVGSVRETENLAVWLQDAGYRTAHIGKFMNGYDASSPIPPGWSQWQTLLLEDSGAPYYKYRLIMNGKVTKSLGSWRKPDNRRCLVRVPSVPRSCRHLTDVQTALAVREIRRAHKSGDPFFIALDFNAPHEDGHGSPGPEPPARYRKLAKRVRVDLDLNDIRGKESKPYFIRGLSPLTSPQKRAIRTRYANEVVAMRSVDDAIGRIMRNLERTKELRNTYVLFTSDNGIFHGEHLIANGKYLPHEPATRQPLWMTGPGLPKGVASRALASNLDIAPTILSLTKVEPEESLDGKSLVPYAANPHRTSRHAVLLEGFNGRGLNDMGPFTDGSGGFGANQALVVNYSGFVAGRWKYVYYYYGEEELYDLHRDPNERWNISRLPELSSTMEWARALSSQLRVCVGSACHPRVSAPSR